MTCALLLLLQEGMHVTCGMEYADNLDATVERGTRHVHLAWVGLVYRDIHAASQPKWWWAL